MMVELLEQIVSALVDDESSVKVSEVKGDVVSVIEVKCAKSDVGKVIGKNGRTADALRTIVNCAAVKQRKRYTLQIVDTVG